MHLSIYYKCNKKISKKRNKIWVYTYCVCARPLYEWNLAQSGVAHYCMRGGKMIITWKIWLSSSYSFIFFFSKNYWRWYARYINPSSASYSYFSSSFSLSIWFSVLHHHYHHYHHRSFTLIRYIFFYNVSSAHINYPWILLACSSLVTFCCVLCIYSYIIKQMCEYTQ